MRKQKYTAIPANPRPFMKLNEAANFMGLTPKALRFLVKNGSIPCITSKNGKSDRSTYLFSRETLERLANGATN